MQLVLEQIQKLMQTLHFLNGIYAAFGSSLVLHCACYNGWAVCSGHFDTCL